ncbi:MAG TPA: ABC transporter substrate-binding protein [Spirochaetales bacterium]|nr:ABC transporter substrate-binding protein [Spirochaetales bacterium]HRV28937.1 ABC transporter substrate-binding protein [Spirochaetia bacterium]HOT58575.1 ABC transporter substrate-binding protein [Spirochaetales bacterium]HPD79966.1 ABC transporter substrate-binding protein [Spirochaetales bacterium]HQG39520.1 ABC transporter substrate-binding protein [Spirochaetales bacterium]
MNKKLQLGIALFLVIASVFMIWGESKQQTIVLGGKAVVMVADVVYAFPELRNSVIAIAGTDQGLGSFLELVSPGFLSKPQPDRNASVETYAGYKPDIFIFKSTMKPTLGKGLEDLGFKVLYLDLESPEDYYKDITALGKLFGLEARANALIQYYKTKVSFVQNLKKPDKLPKVLVVQYTADGLMVPPDSWIQTRMIAMAGGIPIWKGSNPGSGWAKVSPEQLQAWNPDIMLVINYREDAKLAAQKIMKDNAYKAINAIKTGKVFGFAQDFYSWDQPDTRWILGLLWVAKIINPENTQTVQIREEAFEFFNYFYGIDRSAFEEKIAIKFGGSIE